MNAKQALKKAQGLWGKTAAVEFRKIPNPDSRYLVGRVLMGMFFEVKGEGSSFEAAFQKAEEAAERDRQRYAALRKSA